MIELSLEVFWGDGGGDGGEVMGGVCYIDHDYDFIVFFSF